MAKKKGRRRKDEEHKREIRDDSFGQLLNESFVPAKTLEVGEELEAAVIGFDNDYVYLDLGTRLDGAVRRPELMIDGESIVNEGDKVTVFITGQGNGIWHCSCRLASNDAGGLSQRDQDPQQIAALKALEEAFNQNLTVEGQVTAITKGGFEVQLMGLKSFCPLSQIDTQYCKNPGEHLDKTYMFKIVQFEESGNNVVISRREYLDLEAKKKAEQMWQQIEEGGVYKGIVTAVRDYGAFVDIGGIEGLLHVSEISYERIQNAGDKLQVGDQLEVAIKNIDRQHRKISLSVKLLMEDPWTTMIKKIKVGKEFQGKVLRMKTYGAFVELFPGVDGMVHISKLGTDRVHRHPKEVLKTGDIITVRVLEIDEDNRKISLTMEKEEGDFSDDLQKLKKDQDQAAKSSPSQMANLVENALKEEDQS
jgi:small subunit ribosomal protein S1